MPISAKREPLYPPCECEYGKLANSMRFEKRFEANGNGQVVAAEPFPLRLCFTRELLEQASPKYLQMGDGIITITVDNDRASYGITGENLMMNTICGVKSPELGDQA